MRKKIAHLLVFLQCNISLADQAVFVDHQNNKTWQKCEAGSVWNGQQCKGIVATLSWDKALQYCASISGKSLWRLPRRDELINYYFSFPDALHFVNLYWSSTTHIERPEHAWYLVPTEGWVYFNYKELDGLVLCVSDSK